MYVYSANPFLLGWLWEYVCVIFFLLLSNRKDGAFAIVYGWAMKQCYTLYVSLFSYGQFSQVGLYLWSERLARVQHMAWHSPVEDSGKTFVATRRRASFIHPTMSVTLVTDDHNKWLRYHPVFSLSAAHVVMLAYLIYSAFWFQTPNAMGLLCTTTALLSEIQLFLMSTVLTRSAPLRNACSNQARASWISCMQHGVSLDRLAHDHRLKICQCDWSGAHFSDLPSKLKFEGKFVLAETTIVVTDSTKVYVWHNCTQCRGMYKTFLRSDGQQMNYSKAIEFNCRQKKRVSETSQWARIFQ